MLPLIIIKARVVVLITDKVDVREKIKKNKRGLSTSLINSLPF